MDNPYHRVKLLKAIHVPSNTPAHLLSFHNADGDAVGWLDWVDGKLTFGGDMAESARIFFEQVVKLWEMERGDDQNRTG